MNVFGKLIRTLNLKKNWAGGGGGGGWWRWWWCVCVGGGGLVNMREKMFQMTLLLFKENTCAKLYYNSRINVEVMARTSSTYNLLSFYFQV